MDTQTQTARKIRLSSRGGREGNMTITGLSEENMDSLEAMLHGHGHVIVRGETKMEMVPTYKELPEKIEDTELAPFFPYQRCEVQERLFNFGEDKLYSPSIIIQSVCGYNWTRENYEYESGKLKGFGFIQMRSQRGPTGQYYEVWFLPSLYSADGDFEKFIKANKFLDGKITELRMSKIVNWLCRNTSFGTLDVSVQRAAMAMD